LLSLNIEIVDFSPEWDYTTGGQKLLVCIRPCLEGLTSDVEEKLECSFGETLVPVKFIQPGVFKCNAPPHPVGFVQLNLLYEGTIITRQRSSQSCLFEYRQ